MTQRGRQADAAMHDRGWFVAGLSSRARRRAQGRVAQATPPATALLRDRVTAGSRW